MKECRRRVHGVKLD